MFRSTSDSSPYLMEPDYGADSRIWDDRLLRWSDHSEYLLGRYSGLVPSPPGISIWDPFQWKALISQKSITTPQYRPPTGRTEWLKAAMSTRGLVPWPTTSPHMPGKEAGMTQGARSNVPTPMETGGAGDGRSWAEQAEACPEEEWRRDRPAKHRWSSPRRWDAHSTNPFPLQDSEGRHEAVQRLYCHASERALAHHDVAAQEMASHHPDLESGTAKSLNNQVLCMISEYHPDVPQPRPVLHQPSTPGGSKEFTAFHG